MTSRFWTDPRRKFRNADFRARILAWSTLVALFAGLFAIGEPLDLLASVARTSVRAHDSSGSVVVVAQDNRSARELGAGPLPRRYDAQAIDMLFARGARRVMFNEVLSNSSTFRDDDVLAEAIKRYPGRVTLAARFDVDASTARRDPLLPVPVLRANASLASVNLWRNWVGFTSGVPFNSEIDGKLYPSFAARLAGVGGASTSMFKPDYSIAVRSIPTVSYVDVIRGAEASRIVAGKDVIIGPAVQSLRDRHHVPTQSEVSGAYIHAIAAETLLKGIPVNLGWSPGFAMSFLAALVHLFGRRRALRSSAFGLGCLALLLVPIFLDGYLIYVDISAGLILLLTSAFLAWRARNARTNALTGLPNLNALRQDAGSHRQSLIALKIRNYAEVTASFLQESERLFVKEIVRRIDMGARPKAIYHGDDSLLWFAKAGTGNSLTDHLEGLHALFSVPIRVGERAIDLQIGFGIDTDRERPITSRIGSVLVCAEESAASSAKWKLYDPQRLQDADWRLSLLGRLDVAIESGEMWVAYQPKLELATNRIVGAEALVRWTHPDRGEIGPVDFVLAAEQSDRIDRLTFFVLDTAIETAVELNRSHPGFGIAVNLSVRMLTVRGLVDRIAKLLKERGLPPELLTLEITESGELNRVGASMSALHGLRAIGVNVSIDDYGMGFSTLDYLKMMPANEIKLDRQFVTSIDSDGSARIMVGSTIEMAHSLGCKVVAEGVETSQVLKTLSALDCDVAQGYLIAKPMRLSGLRSLLRNEHEQRAA